MILNSHTILNINVATKKNEIKNFLCHMHFNERIFFVDLL